MPEAAKGSASTSSKDVSHMERNRREKMTEFFAALQSMVPNLFPKATRTRIIDETIAYIKGLEDAVAALEAAKAAAAAAAAGEASAAAARAVRSSSGAGGRSSSSAVEVTVSAPGSTAFFGVRFGSRGGAVTRVLEVFERHKAEVLAAAVASDGDGGVTVTVTAAVGEGEGEVLQKIKEELMSL